ncbi:hypothetical protein GCM10023350_32670 [Nocardioides endophyticus]|uniref:Uncharacterized protein n=1 Tax=Nocardioides endophyticus TaxID=1353775 RepID=A0ABP8Z3A2_9ACTN
MRDADALDCRQAAEDAEEHDDESPEPLLQARHPDRPDHQIGRRHHEHPDQEDRGQHDRGHLEPGRVEREVSGPSQVADVVGRQAETRQERQQDGVAQATA